MRKLFLVETLTAERLVELFTANDLELLGRACAVGETCVLIAVAANSLKLLYFLSLWDQLHYVLKAGSQESAI